jgi:DNA-binding NarL/FixJ family response regulator
MKIIVADDSITIRQRIVKLLATIPNLEVIAEASDGIEASILIRKLKPDLVVLDLNMPKLSGLQLLPSLKEMVAPPIVVVLTNYSTAPLKAMCIRSGADFFFDKSTEFENAIRSIEKLCAAPAQASSQE